jgi:hypothetical protein
VWQVEILPLASIMRGEGGVAGLIQYTTITNGQQKTLGHLLKILDTLDNGSAKRIKLTLFHKLH